MLRAVVEGICFGLKDCLEIIQSVCGDITHAKVIGGGAKSEVWLQLLADILNIKINTIDSSEGGAFGAAILAMVGDGEYQSVEEACNKLIHITNTYEPNPTNVKWYEQKYARYQRIYEQVKKI